MESLIPSKFSFGCRNVSVPKASSLDGFLTEVSRIRDQSERIEKLDDYVNRLEVEIKKIEVFKRELPLCMLLLSEAIATMKEELLQCKNSNAVPVLKEFIPLKRTSDEQDEKNEISRGNEIKSIDKMNWMSSLQLCNSVDQNHHSDSGSGDNDQNLKLDKIKGVKEDEKSSMVKGLFHSGINMAVDALVPLKGQNNFPVMMMRKDRGDELNVFQGLMPQALEVKNPREEIDSGGFSSKSSCSRSGSSSATNDQSNVRARKKAQQMARKQRRCWSPELHRRFIDALQQLGGAQAATPKQIRELMQVDGLSNDEVKSHLQKYRLHHRKVTAMSPSSNPVVLGGSWMSQEQYSESAKLGNFESGSPQGHFQINGGDSMEDEDDKKAESQSRESRIQLSWRNGY